jgi:DNA-directed RNA polymerase subunit RPC12/RpoP
MKKHFSSILLSLFLCVIIISPALAQGTTELKLSLNRDFGYGGMNNDIQGIFSLVISNPSASIVRVEFTIDGELIIEDNELPFKIQFSTDSYPLGEHVLAATGYTLDNQVIQSNDISRIFVSESEGWNAALKILGPILGLTFGVILLAFLGPFLFSRKQANIPHGSPRNYGIKGGAICPKCARPFVLRILSLNVGIHKLERCPYCGKWSLLRPRPLSELRAAEAAELAGSQGFTPEISEEEKLRKEIDDSRYQNS